MNYYYLNFGHSTCLFYSFFAEIPMKKMPQPLCAANLLIAIKKSFMWQEGGQ
jgi:hypothetical protein